MGKKTRYLLLRLTIALAFTLFFLHRSQGFDTHRAVSAKGHNGKRPNQDKYVSGYFSETLERIRSLVDLINFPLTSASDKRVAINQINEIVSSVHRQIAASFTLRPTVADHDASRIQGILEERQKLLKEIDALLPEH